MPGDDDEPVQMPLSLGNLDVLRPATNGRSVVGPGRSPVTKFIPASQ